ncbi:PREDICTED: uncharacterized protein LOC104825349 [Tarenaya hassleriana]|uniref:uncharacterized protein LOC104825349 n=1 Tax=Tarenaya hassleriana TaxID=28532 RepID=UPI00053C9259|nr:PREDICTED: uncharacterized protein LOC104825349 [Tarenaya hassleriana]
MTGHWSRTCRTAKHLVDFYQKSIKTKEKDIETNHVMSDYDDDASGAEDFADMDLADVFAHPEDGVEQVGNDAFVTYGFSSWNKTERLASHVGDVNSFHNNARKKSDDLMRQGLPFRDHDKSENSDNKGNFLELVKYIAEQSDVVSKITQDIMQEIGHDMFGLLVDESSDVSHKEQMAVVFRFVDKNGIVKERFIDLVQMKETSVLSLKSAIDSLFAKYGLSLKKVRGQGYDGAIGASCKRKDMIRENHRIRVNEGINNGEISIGKRLNQDITLQRPRNTCWRSHYKTLLRLVELFSSIIDLQEFNDRFDEINSELLICMATLSLADSFREFNISNLVKLARFYPDDFSSLEHVFLQHELRIYIDNLMEDDMFSNLTTIGDLARLMVETKKHLSYPLVYKLLKLVLILPVATATVERCFSAMNFVKTALRNRIGDPFLSDCLGERIAVSFSLIRFYSIGFY